MSQQLLLKAKSTLILQYLTEQEITEIENNHSIMVSKKPIEVGIDPYYKLIDRKTSDNRKKVSETSDKDNEKTDDKENEA